VFVTGSAAPENPVPLLPTDGGNFVALQKKSLVEFSDTHGVRICFAFFTVRHYALAWYYPLTDVCPSVSHTDVFAAF